MNRMELFYSKAYTWILSFGPRILLALIVLVVGWWAIRLVRKSLFNVLAHRHMDASLKPFLEGTLNIVLRVLLFFAVLQILGIQMTVFAALIGAFGVAAGLALSGTLQNFASGVLILLLKPYEVGDRIITQGQEGTVMSIQMFYTIVLTLDNKTVIVPNSKLSNEIIFNLSRQGTRRLDIALKFNYGYDFETVKSILLHSVKAEAAILSLPEYRVGIDKLETDGYTIVLQVWTGAESFERTRLALNVALVEDLKNGGVVLAGMKAPA